jgi:flagellin
MARINSNIPSLIARANLNSANSELQTRLQRLSTGLRINRGADDPAGLIISERLRSEISGLNTAVSNSNRASSVIATTEGALAEVSNLLSSIKGLVVEAANTGAVSDDERKANQVQIDSAIDSITRISNSTSFAGLKLLNGSLDYTLSGVQSSSLAKVAVTSANFSGTSNVKVDVQTLNSAQTASIFLSASTGVFLSATTIAVSGPKGVQEITIASGQPLATVISAVNAFKAATGVSASLLHPGPPANPNSGLRFSSTDFGSKQFVSVERVGGPASGSWFKTYKAPDTLNLPAAISLATLQAGGNLISTGRDKGRDVAAIVNGNLATGDGLNISIQNSAAVSVQISLAQSFGTTNNSSSSFYITGGGALYQLGGQINASQQTNIGVQSISASRLGGTLINGSLSFLSSLKTGGGNDLLTSNARNSFTEASSVLESSIDEVSTVRGRLGAFEKNTLQTNVRSLQSAVENLTASESVIRDADFAEETSKLTRAQILSSAATSVLQLSNQQSQQVLSLLK